MPHSGNSGKHSLGSFPNRSNSRLGVNLASKGQLLAAAIPQSKRGINLGGCLLKLRIDRLVTACDRGSAAANQATYWSEHRWGR